jgi:HAD superfamily hydrolase (TIGR01509 family)
MTLAAVAWDIDGTLIDSEGLHHATLMQVSAAYGLPIAADDQRFVGIGMDQVWQTLRPAYPVGLTEEVWQQAIRDAYQTAAPGLQAFPGALEAMRALHAAGIPQCCVSNSARRIVDVNLAAIGATPYLRFSLSRDEVTAGKPDPESYLLACRRLGLAPAQVLVVEDSDTGAAAARAAGCALMRVGVDFTDYDQVVARLPKPPA